MTRCAKAASGAYVSPRIETYSADEVLKLLGPAIAVYSLASPQPPQVQRANIIVTNLSISLFLIVALIGAGVYDLAVLTMVAVITPLVAIGVAIPQRDVPRFGQLLKVPLASADESSFGMRYWQVS